MSHYGKQNQPCPLFGCLWTLSQEERTEAEGPEENELVDGLRDILHKQKEAHSEDSWYNDITKLLNRLNIPLHESLRKFK